MSNGMYSYDRTARAVPFTEDDVEKMRKDILVLMKNVDKISLGEGEYDYSSIEKDYEKLRAGVREWYNHFDEVMYKDFIPNIQIAIRIWLTGSDRFPDSEYLQKQENDWAKQWEKKLRTETWDLKITLMDMPRLQNWTREKKKWAEKVKREARAAWKALGDFLTWLKGRDVTPTRDVRVTEQVRIEGFNITVIGYEDSDYDRKSMEIFKEALKMYRARASAVAPVLLKQQVPLVFRFDCNMDKGGEYLQGHIEVCAAGNGYPKDMVKTLAHEMGHHLFKQISAEQEKYWTTAIHQDLGDLDLRDLLKEWKPGESIYDVMDRSELSDPVLSLQLQGVLYGHSRSQWKPSWHSREELESYLAEGGSPTWTVPKHPITGYASKNPEEAFCETIGLAVAYGPQTLDPLVRHWFETIMPGQVKFGYTTVFR